MISLCRWWSGYVDLHQSVSDADVTYELIAIDPLDCRNALSVSDVGHSLPVRLTPVVHQVRNIQN